MKPQFAFPALAACVVTSAMIATPALAKPLGQAEMSAQLIGKKVCIVKTGLCARHNADGSSEILAKGTDTGTWRFNGDTLCSTWTKMRGGKEGCGSFTSRSGKYFYTSHGKKILITAE